MPSSGAISDVVIIGYGPTGQLLSLLLARKGHRVVVVERWPNLYPLPRAVHFDHEVARILQAAGVVDDVSNITEGIDTYEWRNAGGELLLMLDWRGRGSSGWPESNMFSQPQLEAVLDAHVRASDKITVLRGWGATAFEDDGDRVRVDLVRGTVHDGIWTATGETDTISGRYMVGADGANSLVRERLGVGVEDLGFAFDWLVVDVLPRVEREWFPKTWQLCDPARPTTVVPGGPKRRRWEFMLLPGETPATMNRPEKAWSLLEPWGMNPDTAELERHAVYTFRALWATRWQKGRAVLAGDAAHLMPPFAGQGMCSGMRDANALAWRLDLILRGIASDRLLDSYGPERIGHVKTMIEFSIELGNVICITDAAQAAERDREMIAARNTPGYQSPPQPRPPLGPGLLVEEDPAAGQLGVQGAIGTGDGVRLFDDVHGNGFLLLARSSRTLDRLSGDDVAFLRSIGTVALGLDELDDIEGVYSRWLNELGATAVLIRPDFYIFGTAADEAALAPLVGRLRDALNIPLGPVSPDGPLLDAMTSTAGAQ
ncbi:bifunctional 3-(3-hydroxy-phenyl)propionate/3-hydroxycinnamic acid hydroxylase MhpA [Aquibium oceanicum]|uniref:bifunctional 3-(3-hydroxy-phenyl)propionate/3-hydroxycinnamic acid hydroxylase MhpA n=1 Tax=Aquibium oceanicum TaxID=1670800 RepID=UPI000B067B65|nr:bifunctional 3-(3-hydroxy-phenyl)propionate/3-hydroxycinnamic acid hydroxylase [Aquibium oceanicum]